jgi:hypothetical protein
VVQLFSIIIILKENICIYALQKSERKNTLKYKALISGP